MTTIIVDDNPVAQNVLAELIGQIDAINLIATCNSASEAFSVLRDTSIDLIFLDIEMPEMNGFDFLKTLDQRPLVIVVSGEMKYGVESYDYNVVDFVLKPVNLQRFELAIQKAQSMLAARNATVSINQPDFIFVKDKSIMKRIPLNEVEWLEAQGDYVKIKTKGQAHLSHSTLSSIEKKLQNMGFVRVHRRFIVAVDKIDHIEDNTIVFHEKLIPVSESYRSSLRSRLNLI